MGLSSADLLCAQVASGNYIAVLTSEPAEAVVDGFVRNLLLADRTSATKQPATSVGDGADAFTAQNSTERAAAALAVGLAAFNAFLQANVTGPVLDGAERVEQVFARAVTAARENSNSSSSSSVTRTTTSRDLAALRRACISSLDVDGVAVYPYVPHVELFCLARSVLSGLPTEIDGLRAQVQDGAALPTLSSQGNGVPSLQWLRWRVNVWHYKLLTPPSPGPGSVSVFSRAAQWSDVPSLQDAIEQEAAALEAVVLQDVDLPSWSTTEKVRFLLEKAGMCTLLGQDVRAREALQRATEMRRFTYALSGALGKRTRFQEKSTSLLVVLARSADGGEERQGKLEDEQKEEGQGQGQERERARPRALELNDDTLLEELEFTEGRGIGAGEKSDRKDGLPIALRELAPDNQPQLAPLDQVILLAEASLKDAFSPADSSTDSLTSEEILPFAVRVIDDKSTNWQIYTQALLLRSRIELHRSRTVERGVLQMQAVVDQVVADTMTVASAREDSRVGQEDPGGGGVNNATPSIQVTAIPEQQPIPPAEEKAEAKPTSFFPAPKPAESAPAQVRLQYIYALNSPPRWHLESELAYSWAGVGSMVSALEIFKRLRLWAEVALCFASSASAGDEDGRGSGGEENAKAVLRWRLFHRTGTDPTGDMGRGAEAMDQGEEPASVDISELHEADYHGPERKPPPPNAPRLLCILGDIEDDPRHYQRAWAISQRRFARAQRALGEHYLRRKDLVRARDAYREALAVNRLSAEMWNRLGDISLRLGNFAEAAEAFRRAIAAANDGAGGEDARTWSNLGSALYSLYVERVKEVRQNKKGKGQGLSGVDEDEDAAEDNGGEKDDGGDNDDDDEVDAATTQKGAASERSPATLLAQALAAYKRGASIAHDNWRIWDNVITLAARLRPPVVPDMLLAMRNIIRLRASEDAVDVDMLRFLLHEAVLSLPRPKEQHFESEAKPRNETGSGNDNGSSATIYRPYDLPRGSTERAVCDLLERDIAPLITARSELWELVARERVWRRDYAGAIDAGERAWRAAIGSSGGGLLAPGTAASNGAGGGGGGGGSLKSKNWLEDNEAWRTLVDRTDELVALLENYGSDVADMGARWKGKARSAVRSVLGKARETWEGSEEWVRLERLLEGL